MLTDKPKLVFSGYVNNNTTDKAIAEAVYRASAFVKPEKPNQEQQYLTELYTVGEALK